MANSIEILKDSLQKEFSMPFVVHSENHSGENHFVFFPQNDLKELFEVSVYIHNRVRIVVEIKPQLHAAAMLEDLSRASEDKKALFYSYSSTLKQKGVKISLTVNGLPFSLDDNAIWPEQWKSFELRVTKSAVFDDSKDNEIDVISEWSKIVTGMFLSLLTVTDTTSEELGYEEGNQYQVLQTKYERNPVNRELCLALYGYKCKICGFDFEERYGPIGRHFIHVHHKTPVSQIGPHYVINPEEDLIPVCPNCHAMLHRKSPPYTPQEILKFISDPQ